MKNKNLVKYSNKVVEKLFELRKLQPELYDKIENYIFDGFELINLIQKEYRFKKGLLRSVDNFKHSEKFEDRFDRLKYNEKQSKTSNTNKIPASFDYTEIDENMTAGL